MDQSRWIRRFLGSLLAVVLASSLGAQDLAEMEARTTLHRLSNGWTFILVERKEAPVFSFATWADVGSAQEVPGITGLAHLFEHMAFKGTPEVGTRDYAAEKKAIQEMEEAYQAYQKEKLSPRPDPERLKQLWERFKEKEQAADQYVVANEFDEILSREGGVGLNATTNADRTLYFFSLPANKVELFAYLESGRFYQPVFREFYKERDVVKEERRLRTESQPIGRLVEQFLTTAFQAHPYQQPTVGHMSDLDALTIRDAEAFFKTYYVPSNMITAVVGHIDPPSLIPLLEKYFGRIPPGEPPPPLRTVEPPQIAQKVVTLKEKAQPFYLEGYHKREVTHPDEVVFDAINDILSNGRTSRLYRSLVRDKKIAVAIQSLSSFPGEKYPNLWAVLAVPARGVGNAQIQQAIHEELERLKREEVSEQELAKFRTRARASLIRSLGSNQGLANQLVNYQARFGDWRELFRYLDRIEQVRPADIQRVARETFRETNRTVATIETETAPATSSNGGQGGER